VRPLRSHESPGDGAPIAGGDGWVCLVYALELCTAALAPQASALNGFEEATSGGVPEDAGDLADVPEQLRERAVESGTQGLKVLQVGLRFGGNDVGSVLLAEGANAATEEQVRQVIRDAGFKPVQRDTLYRTMFLN